MKIHLNRLFLPVLCLALMLLGVPALADNDPILEWMGQEKRIITPDEDTLEVHFINVASADCILLRMGDQTLLVDCGRKATSERVLKYFSRIGVERLDMAFMTHPHNDHISGFENVLREIPVDRFLEPVGYEDFRSPALRDLKALLETQGVPMVQVTGETTMAFGKAELTFYQFLDPATSENNRSMMIHVRYGERSVLLTADVSDRGQRMLAAQYGDALKADILKMPHHGFAVYRKELNAVVQPELATFSNVKENIWPDTLAAVERWGIPWLLTTKGTIFMETDGLHWTVWQ